MAISVASRANFITIRVTGFLRKDRSADMKRAIQRGVLAGGRQAIRSIKGKTPVFEGELLRSYQLNLRTSPLQMRITSPLAYVGVMERGRRPGRRGPPIGPIRNWVANKLFIADPIENKRVAFLIGRSIARKGITVFASTGLLHNRGKGAMFIRTARELGPNFYSRKVIQAINRLR